MITENYVSFEVAKLLKEKGFDEQCTYMYDSQHKLYSTFEQCRQVTRNNSDWIHYVGKLNIVPIAVPTHQMAIKWLREACAIEISIACFKLDAYRYDIYEINSSNFERVFIDFDSDEFCSYEEAVEAAIKHCLTNLI